MTTENEKLNKFINAVNDEIDSKIESMLDNAESERNQILNQAEQDAKEAADKHYNVYYQKNDKNFVREISCSELNAKKSIIQHREKIVERLFNNVEQRLIEFRSTPKYADMLIKNLLLMHISEGAEIYLCSEDMKYSELLKKAVPAKNLKILVSNKILLGGIMVYNPEKGTIIDKTFDLAIEEKKRAFTNSNAFAG